MNRQKEREERIMDIRKNPHKHQHRDLNELTACCTVDGYTDTMLMQIHEEVGMRRNGGSRCDVRSGPCGCGGWH